MNIAENNSIFYADCLEILRGLPDGSVDLFLQDPPYNTTQNAWEYEIPLSELWKEWLRVGKDNAAFIFMAAQPFTTVLICSNRKLFRYDLVWYKPLGSGFLNANRMPMRNHENILVFYNKLPTFNPIKEIGKMRMKGSKNGSHTKNYGNHNGSITVNNEYNPQSVISISNSDRDTIHPTQKPIDLFRYLIRSFSNPNDTVFDGYSGSGTTAAACILENRNFICCENDFGYFEKSKKRLEILQVQPVLF